MQRTTRWLIGLAGIIAVAAIATGGGVWYSLHQHQQPSVATDKTVIIKTGSGARAIARQLAQDDVIPDATVFLFNETILNHTCCYKAGEYAIPAGSSPLAISAILRGGTVVQHSLTVVEGSTSREIIHQLNSDTRLKGAPVTNLAQGSILPETYFFTRNTSRMALVERMQDALAQAETGLWPTRQNDLPFTSFAEAVILASIVEKETGKADEHGTVASVFINRLRLDMPLQSDPTVIYALTEDREPLGRALLRQDWQFAHPFNTYQHTGLPPAPICHPSLAAIKAVLNPPKTPYIYFVADGTGGHVFATTLAEHNRNVARWRQIRNNNKP